MTNGVFHYLRILLCILIREEHQESMYSVYRQSFISSWAAECPCRGSNSLSAAPEAGAAVEYAISAVAALPPRKL